MSDQTVELALAQASEHASIVLWRRIAAELQTGPRILIIGRDAGVVQRFAEPIRAIDGRITVVTAVVAAEGEVLPLHAQDLLLSAHGVLVPTPVSAALSKEERHLVHLLGLHGAPSARAVALADVALLGKLSDDPEREALEVRHRAEKLVPTGWALPDDPGITAWVRQIGDEVALLTPRRLDEVGGLLLREALVRAEHRLVDAAARVEQIDQALRKEDVELEQIRLAAERIAAHQRAIVKRHTEALLVDLRDFLGVLEADVPAQVQAVAEVAQARRALPHWIQHVSDQWIRGRLGSWRLAVLADLESLSIAEADGVYAELLLPSLHPPPVATDSPWARRVGTTAAVGAGAVLLAFGLWIPGLLALGGGLAVTALSTTGTDEEQRLKLAQAGAQAIRAMARDAEGLLGEQIAHLEQDLAGLGQRKAQAWAEARVDVREGLSGERARGARKVDEVRKIREDLMAAVDTLRVGAP